ncbi:MAG: cell wall-active antibiotics response protein [Anaerolineae bacterium]|nr:cell wall-active antibiotics response protein [Anaerolineae bacterium]
MSRRNQVRVGAAITIFGLLLLVGNLLQVNLWAYLWPLILIGLGAWLILRPQTRKRNVPTRFLLLGDIRRRGPWSVREEDIWLLIGDVDLDFTQATLPEGETTVQIQGFVGGVDVRVPEDLGIRIRSTAFLTDAHVLGSHQEHFVTPFEFSSSSYGVGPRTVNLELLHFVTDLNVRQVSREA